MSDNAREPIEIEVSMGYTANMGDFESLRIDIGIRDTQQPGENAREAYERVFNFVNKRLQEKVTAVKQELSETRAKGGY